MSYYNTCPFCGCHLDPGEVCDCRELSPSEPRESKGKAAPDTTRSGKADPMNHQ